MAGRKAGSIVQSAPNAWLVRVYLGEVDGKRKYLAHTVRGNRKDAQDYLRKALAGDILLDSAKITVDAYLDRWLRDSAAQRVSPKTLRSYQDMLRLYVRPLLGRRRLAELTAADIQHVYAAMLERGLSPRTVRLAHSTLYSALRKAVLWQVIVRNPAEHMDLPRQVHQERRAFSAQEARRFVESSKDDPHHALFLVALVTGMRPGEYLALQWPDVDLELGIIHVQRALEHMGASWRFKEPKTVRSRRSIPLPESVTRALTVHRRQVIQRRLRAGEAWQDHNLIFPGAFGGPLDEQNLYQRNFKRILQRADLPSQYRLYDLRHCCASLLLAAGVNPKVVQERLGHASVALTLDTYSHVLPGIQEAATENLSYILFG